MKKLDRSGDQQGAISRGEAIRPKVDLRKRKRYLEIRGKEYRKKSRG